MLNLNSSAIRGRVAEERCIRLACSLKELGFVQDVRKASSHLDARGIDVIIYLKSRYGGKEIPVPVQVKSSRTGVRKFRREHPECMDAEVLIIVINERRTDKSILIELLDAFQDIQRRGVDYRNFLETCRHDLIT